MEGVLEKLLLRYAIIQSNQWYSVRQTFPSFKIVVPFFLDMDMAATCEQIYTQNLGMQFLASTRRRLLEHPKIPVHFFGEFQ